MNLAIHVDRAARISLQDQLFEQLRQMILCGRLKPNSRVIATRFLAEQAGVSRTTVLLAYERLISEGYLETRPTVGTFVSANPPAAGEPSPGPEGPAVQAFAPLARTVEPMRGAKAPPILDLRADATDGSNLLPEKVWRQALRSAFACDPEGLARPHPTAGSTALRRMICDRLVTARGIMASPDQTVIVSGRRHAVGLAAHTMVRRGDRVVVEWPGDEEIVSFFRARGAEVVGVPVDAHGIRTDALPSGRAALIYVTPARQSPIGGVLTAQRRIELLEWAAGAGAYVIEDESDCEFRYHGTTPPPLASLDGAGRVFYTGSFAKTLGAGLGVAYMVVPQAQVDPILAIKSMAEAGGGWLEQAVVARLIADGGYDHHLRRVRKVYLERRDALIEALQAHFGAVQLIGVEIGAQLTWLLSNRYPSATAIREAAAAQGLRLDAVAWSDESGSCASPFNDRALILGYAGQTPDQIRRGVARLAKALGR